MDMAKCKVLSQHLPLVTEENNEKPQSGYLDCGTRLEQGPLEFKAGVITTQEQCVIFVVLNSFAKSEINDFKFKYIISLVHEIFRASSLGCQFCVSADIKTNSYLQQFSSHTHICHGGTENPSPLYKVYFTVAFSGDSL
jgi:hypothetical protein